MTPTLTNTLVNLAADSGKPVHASLSARELQVMRMIASGMRAKDIARELSLSAKTVATYRERLLDKMHMKTNAQLIRYAIEHGLIE